MPTPPIYRAILGAAAASAAGGLGLWARLGVSLLGLDPFEKAVLIGIEALPLAALGALAGLALGSRGHRTDALLAGVIPAGVVVGGPTGAAILALGVGFLARPGRWTRGALAVALLAALGAPLLHRAPQVDGGSGPNVLLISVDAARADRWEGIGDHSALRKLATEGIYFSLACAQSPLSAPSHVTLLSGVPPWTHRALEGGFPAEITTLAEPFASKGYATAAFVSHQRLARGVGFARGFSVFDDDFSSIAGIRHTVLSHALSAPPIERRGDLTAQRARAWLLRQHGSWLAWVHFSDPNSPFSPPPPYDERYYKGGDPRDPHRSLPASTPRELRELIPGLSDPDYLTARYDGELAWTDAQIQTLVDQVGSNTIIVVVGAHGIGLGEEGEWFTHGRALYEHDLRVPLAMRLPGVEARRIPTPVDLSDVADTILDYAGISETTPHSLRTGIEGLRLPKRSASAIVTTNNGEYLASTRGFRERVIVSNRADSPNHHAWWREEPPPDEMMQALTKEAREILDQIEPEPSEAHFPAQ